MLDEDDRDAAIVEAAVALAERLGSASSPRASRRRPPGSGCTGSAAGTRRASCSAARCPRRSSTAGWPRALERQHDREEPE